ncbi:Protein of uncharacterised function (DUF3540) [Serratia entomophila]|jgi:hypothetical protein|uniref:DUF3540 domain-containing protein n=1 Tax=Serratia entomophila TaxID=42906 RepID=A0ABY5CM70_9GAMM|nr:DUF3540 domain-containing protein [Serratia entomophila]UIW16691.1 DUF3540 domain-containing protein [Serratia entomophila]USU99247.1 DUF3540 domain-containing protein [Serratia entomophila]CAI0706233.1 Protein of uncharacterised function (DUF3540) [Serratia entomophila]CAI0706751.1 Protein of uncharacterised function (DUF3540) [Serratia entomophila]CAI0707181.1 Protein of uncharacterised function (DUF3540) [Serratia entomophila]
MSVANTTRAVKIAPPQQAAGQVVNLLPDGSLVVECQGRGWHCRRAASCLLAPALGDSVLVAGCGHQLWAIAVLERADPHSAARLSVEGDLQIETPRGSLSLHSAQALDFNSEALTLQARSGDCHIDKLTYSGEELSAFVSISRMVGKRCESLWHSVSQISHTLFRTVRQTEHVRAGQLDYQAEDYARVHARNTIITSKDITKLDSEQIHVG